MLDFLVSLHIICYYTGMSRLLKAELQRRSDEIKQLILSGKPFEDALSHLYTELRLNAQHRQIIALYHFLLLYTGPKQTPRLYHAALLQALLLNGHTEQATVIAKALLLKNPQDPEVKKLTQSLQIRKEGQLPAYTPLTLLSQYARRSATAAMQQSGPSCPTKILEARLHEITPQKLAQLGYYEKKKQLEAIARPYRAALQENFDEFLICYILGMERAVIGLTGTLLEMLLALHLHKQNKQKKHLINGQRKTAFELSLNELLHLYNEQKLLPKSVLNLCRAARMQRNFIHPGKEILEKHRLTSGDVQICFLAVMETIDYLL